MHNDRSALNLISQTGKGLGTLFKINDMQGKEGWKDTSSYDMDEKEITEDDEVHRLYVTLGRPRIFLNESGGLNLNK